MKKLLLCLTSVIGLSMLCASAQTAPAYTPSKEVQQSQKQFSADRFGIFIHWGIYSMFGQGEWYLEKPDITADEYSKAASAFYPVQFNAKEWVDAIRESGARYTTITSRHHDGFSMWGTKQSPYNIVDATPYGKDILKEFAEECNRQGINLHLYYSHIDWGRPDYPRGRTAKDAVPDSLLKPDWEGYYNFMNNQLTELLTNYGPIRAIWFDGVWDHDQDSVPFDWNLGPQYELIHNLQPSCLVANNHHIKPFQGENIQIFERDLPGENTEGLSGQEISRLPLETCNTMNNGWGYWVKDQHNYKDTPTLIRYLVKTAGMGANLLLNVGPLPNGKFPDTAVARMKEMGQWLKVYGETIYDTEAGDFPAQEWGTSTRKGDRLFAHIISAKSPDIVLPLNCKVKKAVLFDDKTPVKYTVDKNAGTVTLHLNEIPDATDYIVELTTEVKK